MTDNPHAAEPLVFALPDHHVVSITGRDATAFAQAQFMNDVAALAVGHWQWNGWLTPKGRVIALFALLKVEGETLLLV
ncbi:MAG: folate-binding protein, partial [Luteimonas sp.]